MRIFTPGAELPIAGHPTIVTTFALAAEGAIARGRQEFVFGLGVGPTPVSLDWKGDVLDFAWMTQPLPTFGAHVQDRARLAAALGLDSQDLPPEPAPQVVSCGNPFLFVRVSSRQAVDAVSIDRKALTGCLRSSGLDETAVFLFALEPPGSEATVYSRMLAPGFGISEDPATGSASGPLGCYLFHHKVVTASQAANLLSLQGVVMQRPSRLFISIETRGDAITRVRVGGRAVLVGRGELAVCSQEKGRKGGGANRRKGEGETLLFSRRPASH
jgi:trans-2,3-dihydro-3-hydroxyanthranilate isomerase